jgi:hypothetical protein
MTLFALQGAAVLLVYAARGFDLPLGALPLGLQLDPIHAVLHLVTGIVAAVIGFAGPRLARPFLQVFAVLYLGLAVFGTFTDHHFGMHLALDENLFHWTVGTLVAVAAFHPATAPARAVDGA